ncbi:Hypothetical protein PBC10988_29350 [Planctomycetales bacterium 10988]|nr:Hypothetical protein PBC10988_29350 [Planctomycetales bacterium 10988]
MQRRGLLVLSICLLGMFFFPLLAFAQDGTNPPASNIEELPERGPGWYFSLVKLLLFILAFFVWLPIVEWIHFDSKDRRTLDQTKWTLIPFGAGLVGMIATFLIPIFWIGYPLFLISVIVPLVMYVRPRNAEVDEHERVFTPDHWRFLVAHSLGKMGIKMSAEARDPTKEQLFEYRPTAGESKAENKAQVLKAQQQPGFKDSQVILSDFLSQGAQRMLVDLNSQGVSLQYEVDGVWERGNPLSDEKSRKPEETPVPVRTQQAMAIIKHLAFLKPKSRAKQIGSFVIAERTKKPTIQVSSQPVKNGERILISVLDVASEKANLVELGIAEKELERLKSVINVDGPPGIFILAAAPGNGLTTTINGTMRSIDRYTRSWFAVEDVQKGETKLENVEYRNYDSAKKETDLQAFQRAFKEYPDAYLVRDVNNADTLRLLLSGEVCGQEKQVIIGTKAKEPAEALLRPLTLKDSSGKPVAPKELAPYLLGVLYCRLVRRLCEECKEAVPADPVQVKQFGLPERIKEFYEPTGRDPKHPKKACPACSGRGYRGRIGMFELIVMDDALRKVYCETPRVENLRAAIKKSKQPNLQVAGIQLVGQGITSVEEVRRALKG